jgi:hypothetical protein
MELLLVLGVVVLAIGVFAGTLLVLPALWRGFGEQWERFPPDARRRGVAGGALGAVCIVVVSSLSIAAPWGRYSVLYVMAVFGGVAMLLALIGAVGDARRVRRRRTGRPR